MSDFGGLGGALMLGQQLEIYRWEDHRRRTREGNALAANDTAWRGQYDNLVNQYNRLLSDANRMADVHDRERALKDRQIAELTAANETSTTQVEQLRQELQIVRGLVAVERAMYREKHPEDFE